MKTAICHYSFHRTWKEKNWNCLKLAKTIKSLGVTGVDYHAGLLGCIEGKKEAISQALSSTGLVLSGLSLSNNFNQKDPEEFKKQVEYTIKWIQFASNMKAPVSRIFGGHIQDRTDKKALNEGLQRIIDALGEVVKEAEKFDLVLALENHGGLPCTGEEQVKIIETINSPSLKATVDVGNYMQCGQEAHIGSKIAAPHAAYIHFKDFKKLPDDSSPLGYRLEACTIGKGDVDHKACIEVLTKAGYDGYVALEYEGSEDEMTAVPESIDFMNQILK